MISQDSDVMSSLACDEHECKTHNRPTIVDNNGLFYN